MLKLIFSDFHPFIAFQLHYLVYIIIINRGVLHDLAADVPFYEACLAVQLMTNSDLGENSYS